MWFFKFTTKRPKFFDKIFAFFEKQLIQILWRFRTIEAFPKFYFYVAENFDYQCKNIPIRVLQLDQQKKCWKYF
jgi:hypothetical protein